jgi:hypothetical protein
VIPVIAAWLAITGVTVIDVHSGARRAGSTVLIRDSRIEAVGAHVAIPAGAQKMDGRGKFLIPGLWDMHVHLGGVEEDWFPLYLANGVTGLREMASSVENLAKLQRYRARVDRGEIVGPHIVAAATPIDRRSAEKPAPFGVLTAADARTAVDYEKSLGVDLVKIYDGLTRDAFFAIIDQAKKQGLTVSGHMPDTVSPFEASDAGMKSIEHMDGLLLGCSKAEGWLRRQWLAGQGPRADMLLSTFDASRAASLGARFARNGTWQCPTFTEQRFEANIDDPAMINDPRLRYVRKDYLDDWMRQRKEPYPLTDKRLFGKNLEIAGILYRSGAKFLAGTDTPFAYCIPGFALHDELRWLVKAGLTPLGALQAATLNPAEYLARSDSMGAVEAGKLADLVLLDADPLADIGNVDKISAVIVGGKVVDPGVLLRKVEAAVR